MCRWDLFHYDLWVCMELQVYLTLRLASSFMLTKSKRTVTLQDIQSHNVTSSLPWPRTEVTISVREYPENYQQKITKNSNFKRHFLENGWSYRCKILHDNFKDQAQWHISKLCSFLYHFKLNSIHVQLIQYCNYQNIFTLDILAKFGNCITIQTLNIALYMQAGQNYRQTDRQTNRQTDGWSDY